jgi:agmatinase
MRGAAQAPPAIRAALASPHGNAASESGLELGTDIDLNDAGDLALRETPEDDAIIEAAVRRSLAEGAVPVSLGGDHSVTFPILRAVAGEFGPVEILHFDAHPDLYDELDGDRRSHASPFARIMEEGLARRLVQVGIRTLNAHQREQALRFGVEMIEMRDFGRTRVPALGGPLYVSIDLDGFDPAFAPGVSHPEPGGLSARDVVDILLAVEAPVVGADIVELNPARDVNGLTAVLAAKLVKEVAALAARNGRPR